MGSGADLDHGARVADLLFGTGHGHVHDVDRRRRGAVGVVANVGLDDHDSGVAACGPIERVEPVGEAATDRNSRRHRPGWEIGQPTDPRSVGVCFEVGQCGLVCAVDEHEAVRAVVAGESIDLGACDLAGLRGCGHRQARQDLLHGGVPPCLVMRVGHAVGEQPVRGPEAWRVGRAGGDEPVEERGVGGGHRTGTGATAGPKPSVSISWARWWSPVRTIRPSRSTWT